VTESAKSKNDLPVEASIPEGAVSLHSILCTEELQRRPSRPPDYEKENRALVALMSTLTDSPITIFQTLADTILDITQCDSAGLSLLTRDGKKPDVCGKRFYWPAIAGMWNPHVGGGTPRNFGPCGDVLDQNRTLLFRHFERRYQYLLPVIPAAEECLLVPFYVAGEAAGTIWAIMHSDRRKFDAEDDRVMTSLGKFASSAYQEQRRAQEQLHEAQEDLARVSRVVAMGELAAAIAHEVNQPLTAIVTNGQFCLLTLDGATSNPDELRAAITAIVNDGTRASGVISRIRSLLKKGAPDRTELDINVIIQDVTTLLRHEFTRSRVSLRTELASDLPSMPGDPVQLQQVLINLIMNAIEATSSSTNGRRTILIRSAENPDGVLVQVQDSGPGIAPELADRIFEPFFTTKATGIGMGLSISHSIIESHGGRLRFVPSSTGALFEFTLPTDDAGVS
jgi:signal transduction histidine kinase